MSARILHWSLAVDHVSGNTWAEFRTTAEKQPYHYVERYHVDAVYGTWRSDDVHPLAMEVVKSVSRSKDYPKGRVKLANRDGILGADGQELDVTAWVDMSALVGKSKERIPKPRGEPVKWCPRTGEWIEAPYPDPPKQPKGPTAVGWYARCEGLSWSGPHATQHDAVKAIMGLDAVPRPGALVWEVAR